MKRFTVTLDPISPTGPFNIYYIDPTGTYEALKSDLVSPAINIIYDDLYNEGNGYTIYTSDTVQFIDVINVKPECYETYRTPYPIPSPTPSPTTSPTT